jgi:hypothetical protein
MNYEHGGWQYNPHLHRWEMTRHSWLGIVARWVNSSQWTAAIEPVGILGNQQVAQHLFTWQDTAQDWCAAAILAALQTGDDAAP